MLNCMAPWSVRSANRVSLPSDNIDKKPASTTARGLSVFTRYPSIFSQQTLPRQTMNHQQLVDKTMCLKWPGRLLSRGSVSFNSGKRSKGRENSNRARTELDTCSSDRRLPRSNDMAAGPTCPTFLGSLDRGQALLTRNASKHGPTCLGPLHSSG